MLQAVESEPPSLTIPLGTRVMARGKRNPSIVGQRGKIVGTVNQDHRLWYIVVLDNPMYGMPIRLLEPGVRDQIPAVQGKVVLLGRGDFVIRL